MSDVEAKAKDYVTNTSPISPYLLQSQLPVVGQYFQQANNATQEGANRINNAAQENLDQSNQQIKDIYNTSNEASNTLGDKLFGRKK